MSFYDLYGSNKKRVKQQELKTKNKYHDAI